LQARLWRIRQIQGFGLVPLFDETTGARSHFTALAMSPEMNHQTTEFDLADHSQAWRNDPKVAAEIEKLRVWRAIGVSDMC
jgi:hypothetical protein